MISSKRFRDFLPAEQWQVHVEHDERGRMAARQIDGLSPVTRFEHLVPLAQEDNDHNFADSRLIVDNKHDGLAFGTMT